MQGKSKHTSSNPKYYEKNYKSQDFLAYTKKQLLSFSKHDYRKAV